MPFTSTHISQFVRKALTGARLAARPFASGSQAKSTPHHIGEHIRQARLVLGRLAHETFPSLRSSSLALADAHAASRARARLVPIRLGTSTYTPLSAHGRLHAARSAFRAGGYSIPASARSGGMVANVGLGVGGGRGFASAHGPAQAAYKNVPMGLRAFAALLSDDETDRTLPRGSRVKPYSRPRRVVRRSRATRPLPLSPASEFSLYFPFPAPIVAVLPPTTETLLSPSRTTILSLPLAPTLSALLDPTPRVPYAAAQVGISLLSSLSRGRVSLHHAFGLHFADRILPLLAHLDGLGLSVVDVSEVDSAEPGSIAFDMRYDASGAPDILAIIFVGRSYADLRALLGDKLGEDATWCALLELERPAPAPAPVSVSVPKREMEPLALSMCEQDEMMEDWTGLPDREARCAMPLLVMPVLDASIVDSPRFSSTVGGHAQSEVAWPDSYSGASSGNSTPLSGLGLELELGSAFDSAGSYTPDASSMGSPSPSSGWDTTSLVSLVLESSRSSSSAASSSAFSTMSAARADTDAWSIPPSDADSDVESAVSAELIGELSEVWDAPYVAHRASPGSGTSELVWAGTGEGFGFAQAW